MQDRLPNFSEDTNLDDRDPAVDSENITIADVHNSSEDYRQMLETMEKFQTLTRRQKRQVLKPSFSKNVRKTLRK